MAVDRVYALRLLRCPTLPSFCALFVSFIAVGVITWIPLRILLHYVDRRGLRAAAIAPVVIAFCQVFRRVATARAADFAAAGAAAIP